MSTLCLVVVGVSQDKLAVFPSDKIRRDVEDVCLDATRKGIPIVVPPAPGAHHIGDMYYSGDPTRNWLGEYRIYQAKLQEKYADVDFRLTV